MMRCSDIVHDSVPLLYYYDTGHLIKSAFTNIIYLLLSLPQGVFKRCNHPYQIFASEPSVKLLPSECIICDVFIQIDCLIDTCPCLPDSN